MRTRDDIPLVGGGGRPPAPPDLVSVDEGPMRRELLRQIAHLELAMSRFARDNCPFEPMPPTQRRGPAVLSTAELEEVRDELHAAWKEMEARVVERMSERLPVQGPPRRRWWQRRRRGG